MNTKELKERRGELIKNAREIVDSVKDKNRDFTDDENKRFHELHDEANRLKFEIMQSEVEGDASQLNNPFQGHRGSLVGQDLPVNGSHPGGFGRLSDAIRNSGWDSRQNTSVEIPIIQNTFPADGDLRPQRLGGILPFGRDERFLWTALPSTVLPMNQTSIQDFRQDSRTLTGTVQRDLSATTSKAVLDPGVEYVEETLKQFAVVIENLPQVLFDSLDSAQPFFDGEAAFQLNKALDQHVITSIVTQGGITGAALSDIITDVRDAIDTMMDDGRTPDLLAVTPNQRNALDTAVQPGTSGDYIFIPSEQPDNLWRLRLVTVSDPLMEGPVLIDTSSIGRLYFGHRMRFLLDPFHGMKENIVRLRYEFSALMHVRAGDAALQIDDDSSV